MLLADYIVFWMRNNARPEVKDLLQLARTEGDYYGLVLSGGYGVKKDKKRWKRKGR